MALTHNSLAPLHIDLRRFLCAAILLIIGAHQSLVISRPIAVPLLHLTGTFRENGLLSGCFQDLIVCRLCRSLLLYRTTILIVHAVMRSGGVLLEAGRAEQTGTNLVHSVLASAVSTFITAVVLGLHKVEMATFVLLDDPI